MKELLKISMSEQQVRDACKAFAERHSAGLEPHTTAEVIFSRKRARATKTTGETK